jgi:hypothetical protein
MARSTFSHAKISGISAVVPPDEIRIEDELQYFGGDHLCNRGCPFHFFM